jgi:hypothetical protein
MQAGESVCHAPVLARYPARREASRKTARAGEVDRKGMAGFTLGLLSCGNVRQTQRIHAKGILQYDRRYPARRHSSVIGTFKGTVL